MTASEHRWPGTCWLGQRWLSTPLESAELAQALCDGPSSPDAVQLSVVTDTGEVSSLVMELVSRGDWVTSHMPQSEAGGEFCSLCSVATGRGHAPGLEHQPQGLASVLSLPIVSRAQPAAPCMHPPELLLGPNCDVPTVDVWGLGPRLCGKGWLGGFEVYLKKPLLSAVSKTLVTPSIGQSPFKLCMARVGPPSRTGVGVGRASSPLQLWLCVCLAVCLSVCLAGWLACLHVK